MAKLIDTKYIKNVSDIGRIILISFREIKKRSKIGVS